MISSTNSPRNCHEAYKSDTTDLITAITEAEPAQDIYYFIHPLGVAASNVSPLHIILSGICKAQ